MGDGQGRHGTTEGGATRTGAFAAAGLALALVGVSSLAGPEPAAERSIGGRADAPAARLAPFPGGPDDDGDGVANGLDALPFLDTERADADGDGYGDSQDRFPHDPALARPVALLPNGGTDVDARGWRADPGDGLAHRASTGGHLGGGALLLQTLDGSGEPPRWRADAFELDPGTAVLHVAGVVRVAGAAVPRLELAVRNRDAMGTSTVAREVALDEDALAAPGEAPARGGAAPADDGWRAFAVAVPMPSRPVSVRLAASVTGGPGTALFDELDVHAELARDADDDGIDDRADPDDDDDGYLDGEDPAPLDPETGPAPRLARSAHGAG